MVSPSTGIALGLFGRKPTKQVITRNDVESVLEDGTASLGTIDKFGENTQFYAGGIVSQPALEAARIEDQFRQAHRTTYDNLVHIRSFLSNAQVWAQVQSRNLLFTGALMSVVGIVSVFIVMAHEYPDQSLWGRMCEYGSVSSLVWNWNTVEGILFKAFMQTGYLLVLFSNFGWLVVPRWQPLPKAPTCCDCLCFDGWTCNCSCFCNYLCGCGATKFTKQEAEKTWILKTEGLFKMAWNIMAPVGIIMVANVPYTLVNPQSGLQAAQPKLEGGVHTGFAITSFAIAISAELVQLVYGEQIFKISTGALQKIRFAFITLAALGMFLYILGDLILGSSGSNWFGVAVLGETFGGIFVALDFVAISYTPISATQNSFIYGAAGISL